MFLKMSPSQKLYVFLRNQNAVTHTYHVDGVSEDTARDEHNRDAKNGFIARNRDDVAIADWDHRHRDEVESL